MIRQTREILGLKGGGNPLYQQFSCKTRLISGAGAVGFLSELSAKRLFLVCDPHFIQSGAYRRVLEAAGNPESEIFDRITPDPDVSLAAEGTARLTAFRPDLLVALGGGSTLDCAKAMAYFARAECPLAAIPTTSGSGSEVTDFAILTHDGVKQPLVDPALRPDYAILDSDFLTELPKSLIADGGFDVLTHALEAAVAKNAGAFSDLYSREAFAAAFGGLPASYAGQTQVRLRVHLASAMAGIAFSQAGLGLCHALSHSLGGVFHVPHGRLNAVLLPGVLSANAHAGAKQYAALARYAGIGGSADTVAFRNLKNGILRLRRELNLPETLAQAGISPRELWENMPRLVQTALADPCCRTNPIVPEDFMVRRILEEAAGRG